MARDKNIKVRRNTAANAASTNPVLDAGELGYETDTKVFKVGDGSTPWTSLPEAHSGTYAATALFTGSVGARRLQTLDSLAIATMGSSPTVALSQGNQIGGAIAQPVFYPASSSGRVSIRGAAVTINDNAPAATSPVSGGDLPEFLKPALTANGDTPSYLAEVFTDAAIVELVWLGSVAPKFRIFIDGTLITYTTVTGGTVSGGGGLASPANTVLAATATNYFGDGKTHWTRLTFGSKQLRRITFQVATGTQFGGVTVSRLDTISPGAGDGFRAMFVGDSFTAGTGADSSMSSYAQTTCRLLGWDLWPSGAGGTGYLNPGSGSAVKIRDRLANDVYPASPGVVVVAAGLNDAGYASASAVQAEAAAVYADIATNLPSTPVVVVGAWQSTSSPAIALTDVNNAILAAAAIAPNVVKAIDPTGWFRGTGHVGATASDGPADYLISSDGTHPTQAGHEWAGRRLAQELAGIGA